MDVKKQIIITVPVTAFYGEEKGEGWKIPKEVHTPASIKFSIQSQQNCICVPTVPER